MTHTSTLGGRVRRVIVLALALLLVAAACGDPDNKGFDATVVPGDNGKVGVDSSGRMTVELAADADGAVIDPSTIRLRKPDGTFLAPASTEVVPARPGFSSFVRAVFDLNSSGLLDRSADGPTTVNLCIEAAVTNGGTTAAGEDCDDVILPPASEVPASPPPSSGGGSSAPPSPPAPPPSPPAAWRSIATADDPDQRSRPAMATAADGDVILFGGSTTGGLSDQTWEFDGANWTLLNFGAATVPAARRDAAMARLGTNIVLFGGIGAAGALGDTWVFNGTTWTEITGLPDAPDPRGGAVLGFTDNELVLFGGDDETGAPLFGDTWTWNGTAWTEENPATDPPARAGASAAYDGVGELVMYGGYDAGHAILSDTWTWNGTDWSNEAATTPGPTSHAAMAASESGGQVLLYGGYDGADVTNETWLWSGSAWTAYTGHVPAARSGHAMATFTGDGDFSAVMYGGSATGTFHTDTWEFDPTPGA